MMTRDDDRQGEFRYTGNTVWGDNAEKETPLRNNIQIDIGVDATDIWMVFNTSTEAVQLTHADCEKLIAELQGALASVSAAPTPKKEEE